MEQQEGLNGSGITIKGNEAPQSFSVEPRVVNSGQFGGSSAPPAPAAAGNGAAPSNEVKKKKKRGRPRKNAGDGSVTTLSPMPISASIPLTGDYSAWQQNTSRPIKKKHKMGFENPGKAMAYSVGGGFTPHVFTVNTGVDVMMKIISFPQQGSRSICILAANGVISNVTLRQPDSSGGTLTYEVILRMINMKSTMRREEEHVQTNSPLMMIVHDMDYVTNEESAKDDLEGTNNEMAPMIQLRDL